MIEFGLYKRKVSQSHFLKKSYHNDLFILLSVDERKYATVLNIRTLHEITISTNFLEFVQFID